MTSPSDDCPLSKCDGSGFIWVKDWSKRHEKNVVDEWKEECECYEKKKKQREIDKKLDLSGIPPIFKDATVGSFDIDVYKTQKNRDVADLAKKAAINYVTNFETMRDGGKGLYFYSDIKGSGKTRLATSIANALVKMHGVDLAFIKSADLLSQIQKTFNNKSETTESEIVQAFRNVEVLVIDDLAVEKASDFSERIIYNVTDYRLEYKKPTIFTSNKTYEELELIYPGGRVNQRIEKMTLEINMPEESIRIQEADRENAEFEKILFGN